MDLIYHAACSLDGYIATPEGGVDWLNSFQAEGEGHGLEAFYKSIDALIMGSATYEFAAAHPPWMAPDKPTWVFTSRQLELAAPNVNLTSKDPSEVVREIAAQGGRRAWLMGGGGLAAAFRTRGLITRYVVAIVPIVLGEGIPFLADAPGTSRLKLVETQAFSTGIVQLSYEVEGNATTDDG